MTLGVRGDFVFTVVEPPIPEGRRRYEARKRGAIGPVDGLMDLKSQGSYTHLRETPSRTNSNVLWTRHFLIIFLRCVLTVSGLIRSFFAICGEVRPRAIKESTFCSRAVNVFFVRLLCCVNVVKDTRNNAVVSTQG